MSMMLPGVELQRRSSRNNINYQRLHENSPYKSDDRSWLKSSTNTSMDESALRARQRLGEKLGYFRPPSRSSRAQTNEGRGNEARTRTRDSEDHLVSRILGRSRHFQINASKSWKGQACVVCLEDFCVEQQVMNLPCSHMYHSKCLLPWIAAHPNCPSCRSPVEPSLLFPFSVTN